MAYTKLFNSIVTSTIWLETDRTRIVWITMLALADQNGEVQASIPGLAHVAGVPVEDCRSALAKFLAPDVDSRTKDDEGRRIEEIEGGWSLLNHAKYRALASGVDRLEKAAERQRRFKAKAKRNGNAQVTHGNAEVTPDLPSRGRLADAQEEAEAINTQTRSATPRGAGKDDLQLRVESLFRRRLTTPWSRAELTAWKSARPIVADTNPAEWADLEAWFALPSAPYRKTDMASLLNNWHAEIAKCRRAENLALVASAPDALAVSEAAARRASF